MIMQIQRYPINSEIERAIENVKDFNLSKIAHASELGIVKIKDFSGIKDSPFHNKYFIIYNDGTYSLYTTTEMQLNDYFENFVYNVNSNE